MLSTTAVALYTDELETFPNPNDIAPIIALYLQYKCNSSTRYNRVIPPTCSSNAIIELYPTVSERITTPTVPFVELNHGSERGDPLTKRPATRLVQLLPPTALQAVCISTCAALVLPHGVVQTRYKVSIS